MQVAASSRNVKEMRLCGTEPVSSFSSPLLFDPKRLNTLVSILSHQATCTSIPSRLNPS
jgi:hypothetical protein